VAESTGELQSCINEDARAGEPVRGQGAGTGGDRTSS
jgi:hypothetical protein